MFFMDWNFPKPEEDSWYKWAYDKKYGKGAYDRDFLSKKNEEQSSSPELLEHYRDDLTLKDYCYLPLTFK